MRFSHVLVSIPYRLNEIYFLYRDRNGIDVSIPYRLNEIDVEGEKKIYNLVSIPYRLNEIKMMYKVWVYRDWFQFLIGSMK